jgi:transcriptional/translational regulatory protein YebC/TACO1
MSGSNRWSKIKRKKKKNDRQRSKKFSKLVQKIQNEARRCDGDRDDPGLQQAIEEAKEADMPKDNIEDAIERATTEADGSEEITYEAYGPGGSQLVIEAETDNRNKSAAEIRHILDEHGHDLAEPNAVIWAFEKNHDDDGYREWSPESTMELDEDDKQALEKIIDELQNNQEVRSVFTNVANIEVDK